MKSNIKYEFLSSPWHLLVERRRGYSNIKWKGNEISGGTVNDME